MMASHFLLDIPAWKIQLEMPNRISSHNQPTNRCMLVLTTKIAATILLAAMRGATSEPLPAL